MVMQPHFLNLPKNSPNTTSISIFVLLQLSLISSNKAKKITTLSSSSPDNIELVELHLPSVLDFPSNQHSNKGLPQHLIPDLVKAFRMADSSFSNVVTEVNPDLVIYDAIQRCASDIAVSRNIPVVSFSVVSAASHSFIHHLFMNDGATGYPFPEISPPEYEIKKMCSKVTGSETTFMEWVFGYSAHQQPHCDMILINNWKEPEAKYMQYMPYLTKKKIVSV